MDNQPEIVDRRDATGSDVLVVSHVSKSFRGRWPWRPHVQVLRDASLVVHPGEIVGLVGENGSGKSTLMKIVGGMLRRDAGEVEVRGRLGYCPQVPELWDKLTVAEHFDLFAGAYQLDRATGRARREELLDQLSFGRYLDYRVEDLSGGTRQKLNLSIALLSQPTLLLLDEPYAGFDWETYLRFWDLAAGHRDRGMGILIVSHLIGEQSRLDRLYTLKDGTCTDD